MSNYRFSIDYLRVLLVLLPFMYVLPSYGQKEAWSLPLCDETVRSSSIGLGSDMVRDTYLSNVVYGGPLLSLESDSWLKDRDLSLFDYERVHTSLALSDMSNMVGGGAMIGVIASHYHAGLWQIVDCTMCDLLIGPTGIYMINELTNLQNSNNPVNVVAHASAGLCLDNTFRFRLFRAQAAMQASLFVALAGVGFAPDYDMPYWYMYKYDELGKTLHFIHPFNYTALTQQIAFVLPFKEGRWRLGYTFDYVGNYLGGHSRDLYKNYYTIGYVRKFETKRWHDFSKK